MMFKLSAIALFTTIASLALAGAGNSQTPESPTFPDGLEKKATPDGPQVTAEDWATSVTEGNLTPLSQRPRRPRIFSPNQPWSYIGGGVNLGFSDNGSDLADTAFMVNSKIGLSSTFSLRPAILFGDSATILVPVTYDFAIKGPDPFEAATLYPFIGGGVIFTTEDDEEEIATNNIGPMLSGGVDYRLTDKIVLNSSVNLGFLNDEAELGWLLGIGYQF
ncbi:hypothetical protein PN462_02610 [Spirulina sp. CS-785/01]|uniref:hypothetical protein n=1 Tax=Spirulina sp. CS-785/01 TaxID=3021716 RepID=UPI00232FFEED|nr:hypothetical protein [Spirulina sp. CS-785/01]MDB9311978.1 hypothetical protein [Spirulina sp. CS-785/01]